ncbi:MAG: hypothetical protein KIG88_03515 [Weeksellaceae bacterium]|nr:hypothetical protein [Weeksellaceae bacterium]
MKKYVLGIALAMSSASVFSQVGITKNTEIEIHQHANLQLDVKSGDSHKGLIPPSVTNYDKLPFYDQTSSTDFSVNEESKGLLMYESTHATFYSYDGNVWNNEQINEPTSFKLNKSRFLADVDDEQQVDCALFVCGRHQGLKFSASIDNDKSFNNLNIIRETSVIEYAAINYTFENSKFIINEPGLYEIALSIPSKTIGVVSLTEGARYQLRGYFKNSDGTYSERNLADFTPDYYGVLGIGGDLLTGAYAIVQVRLNEGDYVIPRIDSPGATVSVGFTLIATSDANIVKFSPREILFTKLSD